MDSIAPLHVSKLQECTNIQDDDDDDGSSDLDESDSDIVMGNKTKWKKRFARL